MFGAHFPRFCPFFKIHHSAYVAVGGGKFSCFRINRYSDNTWWSGEAFFWFLLMGCFHKSCPNILRVRCFGNTFYLPVIIIPCPYAGNQAWGKSDHPAVRPGGS